MAVSKLACYVIVGASSNATNKGQSQLITRPDTPQPTLQQPTHGMSKPRRKPQSSQSPTALVKNYTVRSNGLANTNGSTVQHHVMAAMSCLSRRNVTRRYVTHNTHTHTHTSHPDRPDDHSSLNHSHHLPTGPTGLGLQMNTDGEKPPVTVSR